MLRQTTRGARSRLGLATVQHLGTAGLTSWVLGGARILDKAPEAKSPGGWMPPNVGFGEKLGHRSAPAPGWEGHHPLSGPGKKQMLDRMPNTRRPRSGTNANFACEGSFMLVIGNIQKGSRRYRGQCRWWACEDKRTPVS